MKKFGAALIFLSIGYSAMAGGMIGGGEIDYKSLITCNAMGFDPTHESSPFVWVVKEVDFNGEFLPNATLRVVTLDRNLEPTRFYVTDTTEPIQDPDFKWPLNMWRYEVGSDGNDKIGEFVWDETANAGTMTALSANDNVEELLLSNCQFEF